MQLLSWGLGPSSLMAEVYGRMVEKSGHVAETGRPINGSRRCAMALSRQSSLSFLGLRVWSLGFRV